MRENDEAASEGDGLLDLVAELLKDSAGMALEELSVELSAAGREVETRELRRFLNENLDRFEGRRGVWRKRVGDPPRSIAGPSDQLTASRKGPERAHARAEQSTKGRRAPRARFGIDDPHGTGGAARPPRLVGSPETREMERSLRERLRGCRIVAEADLEEAMMREVGERVRAAVSELGDPERLGKNFPALLTVHLVAHGTYGYSGNEFWPTIETFGLGSSQWGQQFEQALRVLGLETFEEMVYGDNALRYVAPILAHGGIPRSALDGYFGLIRRFLRQADDAVEMLALWRLRRAPFAGIVNSVRRFLLFGGDLAVGFIDRTIDLFREYSRSNRIPTPDDVGLPAYVVEGFRSYVAGQPIRRSSITRRASGPRPVVQLDPWGGSGVSLELPVLPTSSDDSAWRVQADGHTERFSASRFMEREVPLGPARGWTVSLVEGSSVRSELVFEGMDELPALFFDSRDGRLIRPSAGLDSDVVWAVVPAGAEIEFMRPDGSSEAPDVTEDLSELVGEWSEFRLLELDLRGTRAISVRADSNKPWRRIRVHSVRRPVIETEEVAGALSADGLPVYDRIPSLRLPPGTWTFRVTVDGVPQEPFTVESDLESVSDVALPEGLHEIRLHVRGPLGADLRTGFVIAPGLRIDRPDRVLMPGEPTPFVHVRSESLGVGGEAVGRRASLAVPDGHDSVECEIGDAAGRTESLTIRVERLLWGVSGGDHRSLEFRDTPAIVSDDEVTGRSPASVIVKTGRPGLEVGLALVDGPHVLQETALVATRGTEGRQVFDLGRFSDELTRNGSPNLSFELLIGRVPVRAARITRSLGVRNLEAKSRVVDEFTAVDLTFDEDRALEGRVARLWPLNRPWDGPIEEPIADEQRGHATISGYGRIGPGRYLAEIAIDDGWTAPVRPDVADPGVEVVQVGSVGDLLDHWRSVEVEDPFDRLEQAIVTGSFHRAFDDDDWAEAGAAAVIAAGQIAAGRIPQIVVDGRGFEALRWLLTVSPENLADALVVAGENEDLDDEEILALSIELVGDLANLGRRAFPSDTMRALWGVAPVVAAALDLADTSDADTSDRLDEFTGWDPWGDETPEIAKPVDQRFAGMSLDQLRSIRTALDLIPDRLLSLDALVAANLEWLRAVKENEDDHTPSRWWFDNHRFVREQLDGFPPLVGRYLDARRPPKGTAEWARVPLVSLVASLVIVWGEDERGRAARILREGIGFAPRLITRDLVMALVLAELVMATDTLDDEAAEPGETSSAEARGTAAAFEEAESMRGHHR